MLRRAVYLRLWPGTRTLAIALAIALGVVLDVSGVLHVYGLGSLMSQLLAAGTALLLAGIAAGWRLAAARRGAARRCGSRRGLRAGADRALARRYAAAGPGCAGQPAGRSKPLHALRHAVGAAAHLPARHLAGLSAAVRARARY